ncbi:onnB domain protein [Burkholderia pseudomallei MSHR456]|nr:onnB domain protein [Burkholderia pseudomallei MSHR456]
MQVLVPADGPERAFAALSALVRGARLEHPSWSVQLLSLERATQAADARRARWRIAATMRTSCATGARAASRSSSRRCRQVATNRRARGRRRAST